MSIEYEQQQFSTNIFYTTEYVHYLDHYIKTTRVVLQEVDTAGSMTIEEKIQFSELVESLKPLYERLNELVPIFLHITQNKAATERLITLKYIFQDQVESLKQNKYIMTLENLLRLKTQFIRYFAYVRTLVEKRQHQEEEITKQFNLLNI